MPESMSDVARVDGVSESDEIADRLVHLRAAEELLSLRRQRAIEEASAHGLAQRLIAERLGTTQTAVHRALRRTDPSRDGHEPASVREAVLRYVVGELERDELVEQLASAKPGHGSPRDLEDGYVRGGQDEIRLAWMQRLIDDHLFEDIRVRSATLHAG